ncbi:hypothetical protein PUN28_014172 [Cardiocondyla obscurior]|uniref:Uncharacterized protein n=1 Tax=Cardiocondyla obscurior TaxID=286306 RepID=A0AAW2EYP3_9HYME
MSEVLLRDKKSRNVCKENEQEKALKIIFMQDALTGISKTFQKGCELNKKRIWNLGRAGCRTASFRRRSKAKHAEEA